MHALADSYAMPILAFVLFFGWKFIKHTKWESSQSADVTSFVDDPEVRRTVKPKDLGTYQVLCH